jgi:hypothetical protein
MLKRAAVLRHRFVELVPDALEDGVIYVSIEYATAAHRCCCGCGKEVITPITPTDWQLTYDGESISLHPSIGNWSFPCESHYWIKHNTVRWASRMTRYEITAGRTHDRMAKQQYFEDPPDPPAANAEVRRKYKVTGQPQTSLWKRLTRWFS